VPAAEQGPGEERAVVGVVRQAGDDPVDAPSPGALGRGRRVPLSENGGSLTPLMGQTVRASILSSPSVVAAGTSRTFWKTSPAVWSTSRVIGGLTGRRAVVLSSQSVRARVRESDNCQGAAGRDDA